MHNDLIRQTGADPKRPKWEHDPRLTRVGRWLRRTSLDELPNTINVIRGEMSIVGPRPPTPDEVELYESWQRQRLNTLPGMTGLWQVSGRSKVSFEEQCLLDIYYIENWSIGLDVQILLRTVPNVLLGQRRILTGCVRRLAEVREAARRQFGRSWHGQRRLSLKMSPGYWQGRPANGPRSG